MDYLRNQNRIFYYHYFGFDVKYGVRSCSGLKDIPPISDFYAWIKTMRILVDINTEKKVLNDYGIETNNLRYSRSNEEIEELENYFGDNMESIEERIHFILSNVDSTIVNDYKKRMGLMPQDTIEDIVDYLTEDEIQYDIIYNRNYETLDDFYDDLKKGKYKENDEDLSSYKYSIH